MADPQCIAAIVHPSSVDADGEWRRPIGTGPYRLKEWRRGRFIELARFAGYRSSGRPASGLVGRKRAYADRLRFVIIPEPAAIKAAMAAGEIDIYPDLPLSAVREMRNKEGIRVVVYPTLDWNTLLIQTRGRIFKDRRMRRALAYAIDRRQVAYFATYGHGSVGSALVPPADPRRSAFDRKWYPHDPAKARRLIKAAGYDGEVLRLQTSKRYPGAYDSALVVQSMLQAVGLNVRIEVRDWATQLGNYYSGDFQLMLFPYSGLSSPLPRLEKLIGDKGEVQTRQWEHPAAIRLLRAYRATTEPERARRILDRLHRLLVIDVPIIGLYHAHAAVALAGDIRGYDPWALNRQRFWGVRKTGWGGGAAD